jgi:hypothetical protein
MMATVLPSVTFPTSTSLYRRAFDSASPADVTAVADRLFAAKRPLILLGNGTRDALDASGLATFQAFVERFGIPVGTTSDGRRCFRSHALALAVAGIRWPVAAAFRAAGVRMPRRMIACWSGRARRLRDQLVQPGDGAGGSVHPGRRRPEDHRPVDADHDGRDR